MTRTYKQLSLSERIELSRLRQEGRSLRAVADAMGRSPSTLSRELRRNSQPTKVWFQGYEPVRAEALRARRRRWDARFKLARDADLRAHVRERLEAGWTPEVIAGALRRQRGQCVISHESIYRFIYYRSEQRDYWHRWLRRRKSRRGRLGQRGGSPVDHIQRRIPIQQRPAEVDTRRSPGHWEADLMLFSRSGQAVLATHERQSRLLLLQRQPNKQALTVIRGLLRLFRALPKALRRTLTLDNGTEFAHHYRLTDELAMGTFFCKPHSPWQKGGIENAIGRMRWPLPRKTDLARLSPRQLDRMVAAYNHTPRKCLGFQTPAQVFFEHLKLLHFNRGSTFRPPPE